jgi:hypothetical protein
MNPNREGPGFETSGARNDRLKVGLTGLLGRACLAVPEGAVESDRQVKTDLILSRGQDITLY